jgi:hypothetical protein
MLLLSTWWHFLQPDVSLMLFSEEDAAGGLQHAGPTYVLAEELEDGSGADPAAFVSWSWVLIPLLLLINHQHGSADLLRALAGADVAESQLASIFSTAVTVCGFHGCLCQRSLLCCMVHTRLVAVVTLVNGRLTLPA